MSDGSWPCCAVIVLAGGRSSRMAGSNKLAADLGGRSVLQRVVDGVPADAALVVVGPQRTLERAPADDRGSLQWAREDPPGTGPAAGIAAGLRALAEGAPVAIAPVVVAPVVVVLAGDAPWAPAAVPALLVALEDHPGARAAVAVDAAGRRQPLLSAHRSEALASRIATAQGDLTLAGRSASWLLADDDGPGGEVVQVRLADSLLADVDTRADLAVAQRRISGLVDEVDRQQEGTVGGAP